MRTFIRACLLALLVAGASASATTLVAMDLPALARGADAVVRGTVLKAESRWTQDRSRIVTDVELQVEEALKGEAPKVVVITQPGGVVGDIGQRVSGLASFEPGEEVVVFLERRGAERFLVAGMAQGKFRVERSSDGKAAFAVPESTGEAVLLDPRTQQPTVQPTRTLSLDELKTAVRAALKEGSGSPVAPQRGGSGLLPGKKP